MPIGSNILAGASGQATGYDIEQSLRWNNGDTPYLTRTNNSPNDQIKYTFSVWVKRGQLAQYRYLLSADAPSGARGSQFGIDNNDQIFATMFDLNDHRHTILTDAKYRDPSAWYHIVYVYDSANSTGSNRQKIYVNGVEQSVTHSGTGSQNTSAILQNTIDGMNVSGDLQGFGVYVSGSAADDYYFDGYLAESYFIDGQALTPASFGETDSATNQWVPIEVTGMTYGTNGFYQKYGPSPAPTVDSFTSTGSTTWTAPAGVTTVSYLVVAGGGGGGYGHYGGGGGGGGYRTSTLSVTPGTSYTVTVGGGGAGSTSGSSAGTNGEDSVFATITASGGGGGGSRADADSAADGGSGGGAAIGPSTGGQAVSPTQGYAGGDCTGLQYGAGGGGAGAVGTDGGATPGGAGGNGLSSSIDGSATTRGGGGGGGGWTAHAGGGSGGGGTGGGSSVSPTAGTVNTGGGGGGGGYTGSYFNGAAGGSGIVILSYGLSFGNDYSGNDNDFTATNLVATDQVLDSPTNNFATFNPLAAGKNYGTDVTLSEGNLSFAISSGSAHRQTRGTFLLPSGKWYFEFRLGGAGSGGNMMFGVSDSAVDANGWYGESDAWALDFNGGAGLLIKERNGGTTNNLSTWTVGNVYMCAMDMDGGKIWWGEEGTWFDSGDPAAGTNAAFTNLQATNLVVVASAYYTTDFGIINFGQDSSFAGNKTAQGNTDANGKGDFYHSVPSGYLALCSDNLSDPSIADPTAHFNTVLYTGDGSTQSITGVGFEPDFLWVKDRDHAGHSHRLADVVRGATKQLNSDTTLAEATDSTVFSAFDSDGFSIGTNGSVNANTNTYVSWNWKAGGTASSNTDGTITSSVSANTTAGFSIVSYTGTGSNDGSDTVGHSLSQAPELYVIKNRDGTDNWNLYTAPTGTGNYMALDLTIASASASNGFQYNTAPTASVFTLGTWDAVNKLNDDYIAYCFHSVDGYSKVFEWDGNGSSDGVFQYLGFTPAFCLLKCYSGSTTQEWVMFDNQRNTYNVVDKFIYGNDSASESSGGTRIVDFVSNGIKFRGNDGATNTSGRSYIGYAVASSPFKTSNAR